MLDGSIEGASRECYAKFHRCIGRTDANAAEREGAGKCRMNEAHLNVEFYSSFLLLVESGNRACDEVAELLPQFYVC